MSSLIPGMIFLGFVVLFFGLIVLMRYMSYRETLALAEKGLLRADASRGNGKTALRWGILFASLGLALTIGIYPLGWIAGGSNYPLYFGPWMLVGLIPLFFGIGLILIHVFTREEKPKREVAKVETNEPR